MNKPTKIYAEILEDDALVQFNSAMEQPFSVAGALMPDAHTGYSLPIGAVVATDGVIVPAWVGYDIGCGMCALKLSVGAETIRNVSEEIYKAIYKKIPVGFNINNTESEYDAGGLELTKVGKEIAENKNYLRALGSLGGGNHFIEIGADEQDNAWIVIHSGSRGVGHGIATHYMKKANPEGKAKDGHWGFDVDSQNGKDYIQDMNWCLHYALENRKEMMRRIALLVQDEVTFWSLINRNHNHAVEKDDLWIHRKGATHAEEGMYGVIPGNMRDGSFIVRGKGNPGSLWSSSHGAGRVLGRKEAKRVLSMDDFSSTMHGITARVEEKTLDESPFAYKNIFDVMDLQKDLVDVVAHIKPIINIKG
jgi:tRNA-splicing ligase RtcB (3'-phosphate/5'-hydroxy nucleic acid ligase)